MNEYLKLLKNIAKIDGDAALYLLKLSKSDKKHIEFTRHSYLEELLIWDNSPQGFEYWQEIAITIAKKQDNKTELKKSKKRAKIEVPDTHVKFADELVAWHKNSTVETPKIESITLNDLACMFPPKEYSVAITGYIPMEYFEKHEVEIRKAMREGKSKVVSIYRGRRKYAMRTYTRREDAHSVVLYWR